MAVTGTGMQNDPYIVHDFAELLTVISSFGVYIKLGNSIDMNEEYPEGISTAVNFHAKELDGDGYDISNIYFTGANGLFSMGYQYSSEINTIRNVNFKNIMIPVGSARYLVYGDPGYIFNCTFSALLENTGSYYSSLFSGSLSLKECSGNIWMFDNATITYPNSGTTYFDTCNFEYHGNTAATLAEVLKNSYITGEVSNATVLLGGVGNDTKSMYSVVDAITACVDESEYYSPYICIANKDKTDESDISSSVYKFTTNQLKDPDELLAIGFPIETS